MKKKYIKHLLRKIDKLGVDNLPEKDILRIKQLARAKDVPVRIEVAELLADSEQDFVEEILYDMSFDRDELVRINAVDSLGMGRSAKTLERLELLMLEDSSELVREYAVLAHLDVYQNLHGESFSAETYIEIMRERLASEFNTRVRLSCCENMALLGDEDGCKMILEMLQASLEQSDYTMVWACLHSLERIQDEKNSSAIKDCLLQEARLQEVQKAFVRGHFAQASDNIFYL